MAADQF